MHEESRNLCVPEIPLHSRYRSPSQQEWADRLLPASDGFKIPHRIHLGKSYETVPAGRDMHLLGRGPLSRQGLTDST